MAQYVKFLRGTAEAYEKCRKNSDTLYFVTEQDQSNGKLYLGEKLLTGDTNLKDFSIGALKDILLSENITNDSLLVYDSKEEAWVNKTIDEQFPVFGAVNPEIPGLVPGVPEGQSHLFLRSDGTWATIENSNVDIVISVDNESLTNQNKILALKNFKKQYYKIVLDTNTNETHYELQVVDKGHPWKPGLEPRTVVENDTVVLGWYEPNPASISGINTQINILQTNVGKLNVDIEKLKSQNNELKIEISNLDKIINGSTEPNTATVGLITTVKNLSEHLDNDFLTKSETKEKYISKTDFTTVIGDLETLLNNRVNLYEEIIDINDRLTWQKI